ncbi:MAG: hypothetical protein JXB00_03365 [Bacteroidales bacterium]|nr:hypothetical protein [Bacteroidales bacterium]
MKNLLIIILSVFYFTLYGQYTDNFDAYTTATIAGQGSCFQARGTMAIYKPASDGEVYPNQNDTQVGAYYKGIYDNDQYSKATITSLVSGVVNGVGVRMSSSNYYAWYSTSNTSYLSTVIDNSWIQLDTGDPGNVNDVIRLEVEGTTLRCCVNDVLDKSIGAGGEFTDASLASGCGGVVGYGLSTLSRSDDREGGDLQETYLGLGVYRKETQGYPYRDDVEHLFLRKYVQGPGEEEDTIRYYLYNDFETCTTADVSSYSGLMSMWPINGIFEETAQEIVDTFPQPYHKVWAVTNQEGDDRGWQFMVNLGDTATEIWCEYDWYGQADFDPDWEGGTGSTKFPGGFYMGDNISTSNDTVNKINGFAGWVGNVSGSSENIMSYLFFHPNTSSGHAKGDSGYYNIPKGKWQHIQMRLRVNDLGKENGFFEIYVDGELNNRYSGFKTRSVSQGEDYGKPELLRMMYFFGAGREPFQDNTIYLDNLVVYGYKPGAVMYNYGLNTFADGISPPIVKPPTSSLAPADFMTDEVFTSVTDTIRDINKEKSYIYWPYYKNESIFKEVILESGTINYEFLVAQWGYKDPGNPSWVKVYSGTGVDKNLEMTFGYYAPMVDPVIGYDYSINNNTATFEIYPGSVYGHSRGVEIRYWQP